MVGMRGKKGRGEGREEMRVWGKGKKIKWKREGRGERIGRGD